MALGTFPPGKLRLPPCLVSPVAEAKGGTQFICILCADTPKKCVSAAAETANRVDEGAPLPRLSRPWAAALRRLNQHSARDEFLSGRTVYKYIYL